MDIKAKSLAELKLAIETAIEKLGPDARWAADYDGITAYKQYPLIDPENIQIDFS